MKAVATCVPHATCVKVTTELSPFCDLLVGWAPGRCWGGVFCPHLCGPFSVPQFLHLEVGVMTALPYTVCEGSASYTWNSIW